MTDIMTGNTKRLLCAATVALASLAGRGDIRARCRASRAGPGVWRGRESRSGRFFERIYGINFLISKSEDGCTGKI
jgi:hypothetical protein